MTPNSPDVPCLPYQHVRPMVRNGDLLLCQGTSSFAHMIRLATGSVWSHVGFLLWARDIDRLFVFESVETVGVQDLPLRHYIDNYNNTRQGYPGRVFIARHKGLATVEARIFKAASQQAVDLLGTKYGTKDVADIALRLFEDHLGAAPRPIRRNAVLLCSEYAEIWLAALGIHVPYNRLNYIAPDDFARCDDIEPLWEIALSSIKDRV